jgi:hypothetical protein
MKLTFLVLLLCFAAGASAQSSAPPFHTRFSGYYRSLVTSSHSWITGDAYGDSLNRLRLTFDARYRRVAALHIDYDNELHFGNFITQPDFIEVRDRQDLAYLDLIHAIVNSRHAYWDTSLYRGYVTLRHGRAELTAGRQRIAWGTAHFWSPADLFNPIDPLQVEGDVRQGVDAAQLEWAPGGAWRTALVYAPQSHARQSTAAGRVAATVGGWDVAAFGGRFRRDWVGGGDVAGEWGGAGLRAEFTYTRRGAPGLANAWRATAGADYAFPKLYLVGEYFYNQGQPPCDSTAACALTFALAPTTELFTRHRHFASGGATYDLTPLLKIDAYAVVDLAGHSLFLNPQLRYNAFTNVDVSAGAQLTAGARGGEFDGVPRLFFLQLDVHF